mgnify:CR=1 FL=1
MNSYTIVLIIKVIMIFILTIFMLKNMEVACKKANKGDVQGAIYELLWSLNMIAMIILIK